MSVKRHLIVMAAGTGGHVMPGLAVAREMQARGWSVSWLGTTARHGEPAGAAERHRARHDRLHRPARQGLAAHADRRPAAAGRVLALPAHPAPPPRRRRCSAWAAMSAFPGGLMASLLGKPLLLVNADAALLLSNKALLPVADRDRLRLRRRRRAADPAARSSPATRCAPRSRRCRSRPSASPAAAGRCGCWSSAAASARKVLNETLPQALALIDRGAAAAGHAPDRHRASRRRRRRLRSGAGVDAEVLPFIDDMAARLADCDVIVCRAGAVTVSELCAGGRRRRAGAAGRQHHLAPARQRAVAGRPRRRRPPAADRADAAQRLADVLARPDARRAAGDGRQGARAGAGRDAAARVADETRSAGGLA